MSPDDEFWLEVWAWVYGVCAVAVIAGVILEGAELFTRRWRRAFTTEPWIPPPERSHKWANNCGDFGWLILVIGLVGEQIAHVKMGDIASREQGRLTSRLEAAEKNAGKANERASSNELARVNLEIELRKFAAPRTISIEQSNKFMALTKDAKKLTMRIGVNWPDRETQGYAGNIINLLKGAGYPVESAVNYGEPIPSSPDFDLAFTVVSNAPAYRDLRVRVLQNAFSDIGLGTMFIDPRPEYHLTTNDVLLFIGPKF